MPGRVRPMLLHRMALVSFRLFCKNLGNLHEFFGQMVYRSPWPKIARTPMFKHFLQTFIRSVSNGLAIRFSSVRRAFAGRTLFPNGQKTRANSSQSSEILHFFSIP